MDQGQARQARTSIPGAVITISDRCARGEAEDRSGPLGAHMLAEAGVHAEVVVVPDGIAPVREAIERSIAGGARVVITSGGTGIGPRDFTPEATGPLITREIPGLAEAIRAYGARTAPAAALSRGLVGVIDAENRPAVLVANAPGSPGGVRDTVAVLGPLLPHILSQLAGGTH